MLEKEKIVVEALELQKEYEEAKKFNKLLSYEPYRYQAEFHGAGTILGIRHGNVV